MLSDCSNVGSSLPHGNSHADEKCLRIVHAYLKDFLQYMSISYCSALFNLSGVGAKIVPICRYGDVFYGRGFLCRMS